MPVTVNTALVPVTAAVRSMAETLLERGRGWCAPSSESVVWCTKLIDKHDTARST